MNAPDYSDGIYGFGLCEACGHDPACGHAAVFVQDVERWYCHADSHSCYDSQKWQTEEAETRAERSRGEINRFASASDAIRALFDANG